jgi:hypothetical protein
MIIAAGEWLRREQVQMANTRKQEIYIEILRLVLPVARNYQTWSRWKRFASAPDLYPELELVHNIPPLLEVGEFIRSDVHWLNTQAKMFAKACEADPRFHSPSILPLIAELRTLVPEELRWELTA